MVIGETTVIGKNVKMCQGVTLGALSTKDSQKLRYIKRHPTVEDDVTIYTGATILGGDTVIGKGSIIGANTWITQTIPQYALVHIQNYLFDNKYDEKIKYDAETLENFKEIQLTRNPVMEQKIMDEIKIPTNNFSHMIEKRKSVRVFDNETLMDKEKFFKIISILRERDAITHRYYYASAGGLYPIDVYVYIKENRIKEIPGGLYYYSPKLNCLQKIKKENVINEESQYFMNKDIFSHSAFSIYFIYDADVSMPKYGGMAYIYACIDTGIMVSLLTYIAEAEEVGSCSIGEMDYKKIKPLFPLTSNMSFLHSMEFGIKK